MIRSISDVVRSEDIGMTLPHEYLLHTIGSIGSSNHSKPDKDEIRFQDLIDYRRAPFAHNGRNLLLQKESEAIYELERLQQFTTKKVLIVDVTLPSEGRDVLLKERLDVLKRLHHLIVVTVTTFDVTNLPDKFCIRISSYEASERIAKTLETELRFGRKNDGVVTFPGAIYQQIHGHSDILSLKEQILVQGLALTQARTHCPLYLSISLDESFKKIHGTPVELHQVVRTWIHALVDAGAERKKLVVCHVDRWCRGRFEKANYVFLLELLHLGVSVLFNMVGLLAVSDVMLVNPSFTHPVLSSDEDVGRDDQEPPSDSRLIKWIVELLTHNPQYVFQILLSTNVHMRTQYRRYGGGGYAYLFEHFKHRILREGITLTQWDQIVRNNVISLLTWYVLPETPPAPKNYFQCSICSKSFEPIEGEYFTKFAFIYCSTKCLRRHSRQKFAPILIKS